MSELREGKFSAGAEFTPEEIARYSRQIIVPEVTLAGQRRLKAARVLCIGVGGLGSPAALYLAAAGVGTIGLVDSDRVELSNLHRQILHGTGDIGREKLISARDQLQETNPNVALHLHECHFTSENAMDLVADYDLVIDGSDNFATRYLSNDVCVFTAKPNIYGSVFRLDGQITVFAPHLGGPCYRCLFPEPPPQGSVPNCAEAGVLGMLPGIVGTMQALEATKLILGAGETLIGRLLCFDGLTTRFREFKVRRDPECPVCGENPTITAPMDYERFCGAAATADNVPALTVHDLKRKMDQRERVTLIDVREAHEAEIARIDGARLIPLGEIFDRIDELTPDDEVVIYCHTGSRSARAVQFLQQQGFAKVFNLEGGIEAWSEEIDPNVPKY